MVLIVVRINCADFQSTVLELLVKLDNGIKELHNKLDHQNGIIHNLMPENSNDVEFSLPDGISLPMTTTSDMDKMESALEDASFRRSLVFFKPIFSCQIESFIVTFAF